jgi:DNA-binding response OmpR family regulator
VSSSEPNGVTIYIAEDNPILLQGLERALTAHGYAVRTAVDGRAALDLLRESDLPDVLLLDVMMPELSGLEVLESVRADARTADLPVILITAAAEEVVPRSRLRPPAEVLMKPFRLGDLLSRIRAQVGRGDGAADIGSVPAAERSPATVARN